MLTLVYANLNLGVSAVVLTFRQALHAKLLALPRLAAAVGNRVYPGILPRTYDLGRDGPALTYTVTIDRNLGHSVAAIGHHLGGSDGTAMVRVQISAWSYRYSISDAISDSLFDALDGVRGATWSGVGIVSSVREQQIDLPEAPPSGQTWTIYQIANEFHIRYRVAIPTNP